MTATDPAAARQAACPRCGAAVLIDGIHPPWCPACDWGLQAPPPRRPPRRTDRMAARLAGRADDLTVEQLVAAERLRPRPTAARAGAVAIAACVHLLTVAM